MKLQSRLIKYQKQKKLTQDALFLKLVHYGMAVSMATVKNWLTKKNEPSKMYQRDLENFLMDMGDEENAKRTS